MSNPVRFALIGTGNIAGFHAEAIKQVADAKLVAAFSRGNPGPFAEKHGCEAVTSLDALLAREDVDAVCITTPSGAHADPAIAAMRAGKHVLCEKPLEITGQRIDAMMACAKETGHILAAVFQSRFGQGAQTVKRAVEAGRFGRITLASAYIKWWRTQQYYDSGAWRGTWELDGGGALMNQGIHAIDLLQWLVGMPVEVRAITALLALGMAEVGRGFQRDRTTVLHACHLVEDLRDDADFDRLVTTLERIVLAALKGRAGE